MGRLVYKMGFDKTEVPLMYTMRETLAVIFTVKLQFDVHTTNSFIEWTKYIYSGS